MGVLPASGVILDDDDPSIVAVGDDGHDDAAATLASNRHGAPLRQRLYRDGFTGERGAMHEHCQQQGRLRHCHVPLGPHAHPQPLAIVAGDDLPQRHPPRMKQRAQLRDQRGVNAFAVAPTREPLNVFEVVDDVPHGNRVALLFLCF